MVVGILIRLCGLWTMFYNKNLRTSDCFLFRCDLRLWIMQDREMVCHSLDPTNL